MPTHQNTINLAGSTPGDILIVDDETTNLKLLKELLSREGYQVRAADLPQLAIKSALAQSPALILLDVKMPEMDGFEVCKRLKQDERTRDVPVIFISVLQEAEDKVRGFEVGGVDFITKPFQETEVLARVRMHLELRNMQLNLEQLVAERTAELARSEAKYRGLVENALVGIFNSTIDGQFTYVNDAMARMFDFDTPEQMIARGSLERWSDQKKVNGCWPNFSSTVL
jgi:PleD family two-component response regulator